MTTESSASCVQGSRGRHAGVPIVSLTVLDAGRRAPIPGIVAGWRKGIIPASPFWEKRSERALYIMCEGYSHVVPPWPASSH